MLSPADFIFNEEVDIPYYLETQHFIKMHDTYFYDYCDSINKITNPHSPSQTQANSLSQQELFELYSEFFPSEQDHFVKPNPYFPGVRFMSPGVVVFERPPMYQVIDIDNDYRDNINDETRSSQYYLPIPWQVYVCIYNPQDMRLNSVKMFFSKSFLTDADQQVFCPPMFNFYSNGNLCRPFFATMDDIEKYPQDINGIIASAYDWVWNSGFNFDITENISQFLSSKKFEEFAPWAKNSASKSLEYLRTHPIYGLPRITHSSYLDALFNCWQSVPLEQISNIEWSNYTEAEFYYQEISNLSSNFFYEYISANDIVLCEEYYDEDVDEDYEHECDVCMSEDAVRESSQYQEAYLKATVIPPKSIKTAIQSSMSLAMANNNALKSSSAIRFSKSFVNVYQKYFSEG